MNRQELVELIAAETGDTKASTERHLDAFIKAVTETLAAGERLSLAGFGHFHATLVRRRVGWNPNAGTSVNYPPTLRVNFKPGSKLKAALGAAAEAMDTPTASPDSPPPSLIPEDQRADFLHDGEAVNRPNNALDIYLQELGCESPLLVKLIMQSIYKNDRREIKHIGCKRFGVQYLLKGIYVHNDLLYFHLQLKNSSNVPFNVDYLTFKITDKKVAKRTAIQEQVVWPVRAYNNVQVIGGKRTERMVFTLPKFTLADDKQLVVELHEQQGGRHQTFTVENADLVRARVINELKVK